MFYGLGKQELEKGNVVFRNFLELGNEDKKLRKLTLGIWFLQLFFYFIFCQD